MEDLKTAFHVLCLFFVFPFGARCFAELLYTWGMIRSEGEVTVMAFISLCIMYNMWWRDNV